MARGIFASVFASAMFGAIYYVVTRMQPLTAQDIFAWRMALTGPMVCVLITITNDWPQVRAALKEVQRRPGVMLVHLLNAANTGAQMWVFMWAPLNGKAMEASLAYFLMPLVMVLIGRFVYKDPMSKWQIAATSLAAIGVAHELVRVGSVSWIVPFIAIGFPLLFVMRRAFKTSGQGGNWIELNLIFVFAFGLLVQSGFNSDVLTWKLGGFIALLATISATSLMAYYAASRFLPFSLFGLLGYLEPVLLVLVAFVLGESLSQAELFTYVPIWLAVALLIAEGTQQVASLKRRRIPKLATP